jgi:dynein heavy chain
MQKVFEVKDKVAKLEKQVADLMAEKAETERVIKQSEDRMRRANKLVVQLADEGVRWKEDVEKMSHQIKKLVGNVFLSCACISYFGAFTGDYRKQLTDMWTT